jgi:para-nitrobenzyl esterase
MSHTSDSGFFGFVLRPASAIALLGLLVLGCDRSAPVDPPPDPTPPSEPTPPPADAVVNLCGAGSKPVSTTVKEAQYDGCTVTSNGATVHAYRGIEYGVAARWQAPTPKKPEAHVAAQAYGKQCPQYDAANNRPFNPDTMSEDCLFVNVWNPADASGEAGNDKLPVMVFIHGGGFLNGAGSLQLYAGEALAARHQAVIVTFNYRLGVLGFLHQDDASGNFGLQDQILALEWVQANIEGFGGDPQRVTLFGESAGAMSVVAQLSFARDRPLFQQAIVESSYTGVASQSSAEAAEVEAMLVRTLAPACELSSCSTMQLMTAQSGMLSQLSAPQSMFVFGPHIEPYLLKTQPVLTQADRPVILGANAAEAKLFVASYQVPPFGPLTQEGYAQFLTQIYGPKLAKKIAKFPRYSAKKQAPIDAMTNVVDDGWFMCATDYLLSRATRQPDTYGYAFDYVSSFNFYEGLLPTCKPDACHGAELPFVFDRAYDASDQPVAFNDADADMATQLGADWVSFASTGRPADTKWQPVGEQGRFVLDHPPPGTGTRDEQRHCDFWTSEVYAKGGAEGTVTRILASVAAAK